MHELSIAQNIVKIVHQEYQKGNYDSDVKKIFFSAGKMNAIIPESLMMNFNVVKGDFPEVKNAELVIEEKEVVVRCENCSSEVELSEPVFTCQNCGSPNIKLVQGREMYVESFEV